MAVSSEDLVALARDYDHVVGVELACEPQMRPPWTCKLRRDRPIHLTIGRGGTAQEAVADVKRMLEER